MYMWERIHASARVDHLSWRGMRIKCLQVTTRHEMGVFTKQALADGRPRSVWDDKSELGGSTERERAREACLGWVDQDQQTATHCRG